MEDRNAPVNIRVEWGFIGIVSFIVSMALTYRMAFIYTIIITIGIGLIIYDLIYESNLSSYQKVIFMLTLYNL